MDILDIINNPMELLDFMRQNITYGFVGKNGKKYTNMFSDEWDDWYRECFVQNGVEVLKSKVGTCWDQVELERLWFEKNNYSYKTFFIWYDTDVDLPTHTFLIYENDGKYFWFENAFEDYRGIHEFNSEDEAISYVKEKQFEYVLKNDLNVKEEDRTYLVCYEYFKPGNHLGVDEYLNHVTSNNYNNKLNH